MKKKQCLDDASDYCFRLIGQGILLVAFEDLEEDHPEMHEHLYWLLYQGTEALLF